MYNVKTEVDSKKEKLTITVDLTQDGKVSASGKSLVFASTEGNISVENTDLTLGLNLYRKR